MDILKRFKHNAILVSDSLFAKLYVKALPDLPMSIAKQLIPAKICLYDYLDDGTLVVFTRLFCAKLRDDSIEIKWLITASDLGKHRLTNLYYNLESLNRAIDQLMVESRDQEAMPPLKACGISCLLNLVEEPYELSRVMKHQYFPIPIPKARMILVWNAMDVAKWVDQYYHIYMRGDYPIVYPGKVFDQINWRQPKNFIKRK